MRYFFRGCRLYGTCRYFKKFAEDSFLDPGHRLRAERIFEGHFGVMRGLVVEVKKTLHLVLRDLGGYANVKERASGPVASALLIALCFHSLSGLQGAYFSYHFIFLTYILCLIALYIYATVGYVDD